LSAPGGLGRSADRAYEVFERLFPCAGIVSYHGVMADDTLVSPEMHVSASVFARQVEFLRSHYNVLPLSEFVRRVRAGASLKQCVSITFDDAYSGLVDYVAPLFAAYELPFTVFVTVQAAATGQPYWWDIFEAARTQAPVVSWNRLLDCCGLPPLPPSAESVGTIREHFLASRMGRFEAADYFGATVYRELVPSSLQPLTFTRLRDLSDWSPIEFGVHTATHAALPFLSAQERETEITTSFRRLRDELTNVMPVLAYPYGLYDDATASSAKASGMLAAVTLQGRATTPADDVLKLPRLGVSEDRTGRSIAIRLNTGLRDLMVRRTGCLHPPIPTDPFASVHLSG
jgi:peptidoglycan/xylan/chitin deacetylase (PgdA/CDA1 family)